MNILRNRKGFSLVEMVVALLVVSLVMAIIFGVYIFTQRLYHRTSEFNELNAYAIEWIKSIEKNILFCKGIESGSRTELRFRKMDGRHARYLFDNEQLFYNSKKIGTNKFKVTDVFFDYFAMDSSLRFNLEAGRNLLDEDPDNDGLVDGEELKSLRLIRVSIRFASQHDTCQYVFSPYIRGKIGME